VTASKEANCVDFFFYQFDLTSTILLLSVLDPLLPKGHEFGLEGQGFTGDFKALGSEVRPLASASTIAQVQLLT